MAKIDKRRVCRNVGVLRLKYRLNFKEGIKKRSEGKLSETGKRKQNKWGRSRGVSHKRCGHIVEGEEIERAGRQMHGANLWFPDMCIHFIKVMYTFHKGLINEVVHSRNIITGAEKS